VQLLFFFFIAIFAFRPSDYEPEDQDDHDWPSFFHMPVFMLMLITLLNDGTLIAIGYVNMGYVMFIGLYLCSVVVIFPYYWCIMKP
tara:strand:- start:844 stop:1101 length:258 start_codon:yes stop_codon:yes gene_type:complete